MTWFWLTVAILILALMAVVPLGWTTAAPILLALAWLMARGK